MISHKSIKNLLIFLFLLSVGCTYILTGVENRPLSTYKEKEQGYERVFISDKLSRGYDEIIIQYFSCDADYLQATPSMLPSYLEDDPCFLHRRVPEKLSDYLRERNLFKNVLVTGEVDSVMPRQLILRARLKRLLLQNREDEISMPSDMINVTFVIEGELVDALTGRLLARFKHIISSSLSRQMIKEGIIEGGDMVAKDIAGFIRRIY